MHATMRPMSARPTAVRPPVRRTPPSTHRRSAGPLLVAAVAAGMARPQPTVAQATPHTAIPAGAATAVDSIFAPWTSTELPGCAVGVSQGGLRVLSRAYGMADLEWNIPNTPGTIFEGGSLSKQFTDAAVVLLALDGALSVDDDVRTYVPELPDYGHTITLRHLMNHTSGLRDWGSVASISGWGREERSHTHADVLDILSRQSALNFPPGTRYDYSNSGYNLLAIIVARVSGMPFAEFSRVRIFEPLGLEHTQWRDDYRRLVPGRATAYDVLGDGTARINRPIEYVHGNGGILTTVGDLLRWTEALEDGRLGGPRFVEMMHDTGTLNDGSSIVYASGLRVGRWGGVPVVSHTGATAGYRAYLGRFPEQKLAVAMLCNASNAPTQGNGLGVARAFLGDAVRAPHPPEPVPVAEAELAALAGRYRHRLTGRVLDVRVEGAGLRAGSTRLVPVAPRTFAAAEPPLDEAAAARRWVFQTRKGERPLLRIDDWASMEDVWEPVEPWSPTAEDLRAFEGTYFSADAETTLRITVEDGTLVVHRRPDDRWPVQPIYRDGFRGRMGTLRFHRGDGGADSAVAELSLSIPRVFDMRFKRVGG